MLEQRIGFIGAGQMATALAGGFLKAGLTRPEQLLASDVEESARLRFKEATGVTPVVDNAKVAADSDVLFLAVKPQQLAQVAGGLKDRLADKLIVSIAAGVKIATLAEMFGSGLRIVRVMPNTPCLVGRGVSAYSLGSLATESDGSLVEQLLGSVGLVCKVDEKLLDAVTGLSGSGPAFVFVIIEALADAGVLVGLPRSVALKMAAETVRGAAEMVLTTGEHPGTLKDRVASPGGTTIAGLKALEAGALRATLMTAVEAATRRSQELGNK